MTTLKRMGCCQSGGFWIADENGESVAVIPAGRYAKDEREMADKIVLAVNCHESLVEALKKLAYWSDRINSLQHAGNPILPSSWSELFAATNAARAALEKAGL